MLNKFKLTSPVDALVRAVKTFFSIIVLCKLAYEFGKRSRGIKQEDV